VWRITRNGPADERTLVDESAQAWDRYDARENTLVLIRPDGYVLGRWPTPDWSALAAALSPYQQPCAWRQAA
jgi:3-(3-hydroxy-phenyl)propionate hydroxylase